MLTIGLLGGMTCESSIEYYKIINEQVRSRLGGIHSAKSIMASVDFGVIEPMMERGEWEEIAKILIEECQNLEKGGAGFLVICTNTMHKLADEIQQKINIPILGIIDATADQIKKQELKSIGLLGTRFTMEQDFYKDRLVRKHGLEVIIPTAEEILTINRIIMDELSVGSIRPSSKEAYLTIINSLSNEGAEGIILGCTEIPLLVQQQDCETPLFDTTTIHATRAVDFALADSLPPFREKLL